MIGFSGKFVPEYNIFYFRAEVSNFHHMAGIGDFCKRGNFNEIFLKMRQLFFYSSQLRNDILGDCSKGTKLQVIFDISIFFEARKIAY